MESILTFLTDNWESTFLIIGALASALTAFTEHYSQKAGLAAALTRAIEAFSVFTHKNAKTKLGRLKAPFTSVPPAEK